MADVRASELKSRKAGGFALVETLVASAIIAGMLGVVFQVIETGARQIRSVENRRLAILVAQSQLAAVGAAQNNSFGETTGVTGGVRWRIKITQRRGNSSSAARLEDVVVTTGMDDATVNKDRRDLFVLRTVRVAR
jgi:type II secretory pathway pseudopilin PulG